MRWHERRGDLSKDCSIPPSQVTIPDRNPEDDALSYEIRKLFATGACALAVTNPAFKKRRIEKQVLFLTLGRIYGDDRGLVAGLSGGGCELLRLDNLKATQLIRIGLPDRLAKMVKTEIETQTS